MYYFQIVLYTIFHALVVGQVLLPEQRVNTTLASVVPRPDEIPLIYKNLRPVYYIVKNRPVTLTCQAISATQIRFQCAGQWVAPERHVSVWLDPGTPVHRLQTSINITRQDVDEYYTLDDYWCQCHAWNGVPGETQSRSTRGGYAAVVISYMKKRFKQEPVATYAESNVPAQLQCSPPDGVPTPEVFWLKDGETIDTQEAEDSNLVILSDGSLVILQPGLEDMGEYTCGAVNVAARRLSNSAKLTVYGI